MARKTTITVTSDNPADSALVTAALNLYFRTRGAYPKLVTVRGAELMGLSADELSININIHKLFAETDRDGKRLYDAEVEIVDQPPSYIALDVPGRPNPIE